MILKVCIRLMNSGSEGKMRIYVLGCGGMLGVSLYKYFSQKADILATSRIAKETWLRSRDVRDYQGMLHDVMEFKPDILMNLAAYVDREGCEKYVQEAIDINTGGSANCTMLALNLKIPYVYISSAVVFDDNKDTHTDEDVPTPRGVYARTKYWGELLAQAVPEHLVIRPGWQVGSGSNDRMFIQKIWGQIKSGATVLNVVADKKGSPSFVKDTVLGIEWLLNKEAFGVYNMVCKGEATRYDMAVEFVRCLGLQDKIEVRKVDSTFWSHEYSAARAPSESVLTTKLDALGYVSRPWQEALAEYVSEYSDYFSLQENK